jgi:hypothetical protein
MTTRSVCFAAVAALAWLASASAYAAALGNLTVLSRQGQPLNAEIEIVSLEPGEARKLSAHLMSRESHARAGIDFDRTLSDVRLSIGRRDGRPVVRVRTTRSIDEPHFWMMVELRSDRERRRRGYAVIVDPAAAAALPPKPAVESPDSPTPPAPAAAAKDPMSREELFGVAPKPKAERPDDAATSRDELFGLPAKPPAEASSRDELFGLPSAAAKPAPASTIQWRGFVQNYSAYDYEDPSHWSRAVFRTQLGAQGAAGSLKWRATVRLDLDPVYAGSDFYPRDVRRDQRRDFFIRETYVDIPVGGLELRLGKQNIVWGEMVGLFFADVVSARDQRDFILPDFEIIRIPQWALRAEHFGDNYHAEAIWLPSPEVDIIGKPGAEFYPMQDVAPAGFGQRFNDPERPPRNGRNSNFGLRASTVRSGWDMSAFYYRSTDVNPTFYRDVVLAPAPTLVFTPRHERIWQVGGTLGKDLGPSVLKAEVIYASGRKFNVTRLSEPTGVVEQDTLDYAVGLDFTLGRDTRLNFQLFQRFFGEHDSDLVHEKHEDGVTLLLSTKLGADWEPELLLIQSLNRTDRLVRTRLGWLPERNWRVTFGVDIFKGPATGFFGRFDDNDRAYVEVRRDF